VDVAASPNKTAPQNAADLPFVVELDRFSGPLELLLHLIREQDIDIFDIPIAQITSQFLKAIEDVERVGLDRAGEFLEMAATLIRIKTQMLLPRRANEDGEWEDPRAELVRRLLEYEHFREVADHLERAELDRIRHFARGFVPPRPRRDDQPPPPLEIAWDEVMAAALELEDKRRERVEHHIPIRSVPLEEKITLILDSLARIARVEFRRLVDPFGDKLHTVVTFVAGLELARRRILALRQREPFGPLWFLRRNGNEVDETDTDH
jgi:segregation and condensation protein A